MISVKGFRDHHRDTVVPVGVAMKFDSEFEKALEQATEDYAPYIYDRAMYILKNGGTNEDQG